MNTTRAATFASIAFAMFALADSVDADVLTFQEGDGSSYSETESVYLDMNSVNNYGQSTALNTYYLNGTLSSIVFVRWPYLVGSNAGQLPAGSSVESAVLHLTRTFNSTAIASVHPIFTDWIEHSISGLEWPDVPDVDYGASVGTIPTGGAQTVLQRQRHRAPATPQTPGHFQRAQPRAYQHLGRRQGAVPVEFPVVGAATVPFPRRNGPNVAFIRRSSRL
jgi:hypothetical protein